MDLVNSAENFRFYAEDDNSEMSRDLDRSWMIKRDNVLLLPRGECGIQKRVYIGTHTASTHPGYAGEALRWDAHCDNPSRVYIRGSMLGRTLRQPIQGMQERVYVGRHTASTHPGYAGEGLCWEAHC
ncbi:hypothetical protein ElyMa_002866300, partial [Elysia marginata]